jgi:hypothetical protein
MTPIETINYRGYSIEIHHDTDPISPREDDNLGIIVGWHRRYNIGDQQPKCSASEFLEGLARDADTSIEEIEDRVDTINTHWYNQESRWVGMANAYLKKRYEQVFNDNYVLLPLYMYDHGNVSLSTGSFSCPWDSGQVGYVYVSKEDVITEYGDWTAETVAKATKCLEGEVETYSQYINGDVYGYIIKNEELEEIDDGSCWGFYDDEYCEQEAKRVVDHAIEARVALELSDASCGIGI